MKTIFGSYRLAAETLGLVVALVAVRAVLWTAGVEGMESSPLMSSIISGGVFVMGLVVAGTLSDYRSAERVPSDMAGSLYGILREAESMERVWGVPNLDALRRRLITVVTALRSDINSGTSRECQEAVEALSESILELEQTDVEANYISRLRAEQSTLRKSALKVYTIQREHFLPSAKAMINSMVVIIFAMLLVTNMGGLIESLVTVAFMSFFFIYLLRLLDVIDSPFKAGLNRTDDDVSLFLLTEFAVAAQISGVDEEISGEEIAEMAEELEEKMAAVEDDASSAELGEALDDTIEDVVDQTLDDDVGAPVTPERP